MRRLNDLREDERGLLQLDSQAIKVLVGVLCIALLFGFGVKIASVSEGYKGEPNEKFNEDSYYEEEDTEQEEDKEFANVTYDPVVIFEGVTLLDYSLEWEFPWWDIDINFGAAFDLPVISELHMMWDVMVDSSPTYVSWFFGTIFGMISLAVTFTLIRAARIDWS